MFSSLASLTSVTADPVAHVALGLGVLLLAARAAGELASRFGQPQVLGELLVGMLLGAIPGQFFHGLGADPTLDMFARLGAILLLFEVGLESNVGDVLRVGVAAGRVAVLGSVVTFALGFVTARLLLPSAPTLAHAFIGCAIAATSVGIGARVLKDLGLSRGVEARTVIGAAVIDDIIALVALALVTGAATRAPGTGGAWLPTVLMIGKVVLYLVVTVAVGSWVTPRIFRLVSRLQTRGSLVVAGLSFCFLVSWSAELVGLSPIVGAFLAGLVLTEVHSAPFVARGDRALDQEVEPISALLVPIFFVLLGLRTDVRSFLHGRTLLLALGLGVAAIVGKLVCGLGAPRGSNRLAVSFGMMPRGEVSLVFAGLGLTVATASGTLLDASSYSALVIVVVLTTVITPIALKWSFSR